MGFFSQLSEGLAYIVFGVESRGTRHGVRVPDRVSESGSRHYSDGTFEKDLTDGTTIYGPEGIDRRPGGKHGHRGGDFDRSPHSTIGSAAVGNRHTASGHKTKR